MVAVTGTDSSGGLSSIFGACWCALRRRCRCELTGRSARPAAAAAVASVEAPASWWISEAELPPPRWPANGSGGPSPPSGRKSGRFGHEFLLAATRAPPPPSTGSSMAKRSFLGESRIDADASPDGLGLEQRSELFGLNEPLELLERRCWLWWTRCGFEYFSPTSQ